MINRIRSLAMKIKGKARKNRDFFYLRVLPIVMVCFMVVSITPIQSIFGANSTPLSWYTVYPTSNSRATNSDGKVRADSASNYGGASVYSPYVGNGQLVGWYFRNKDGGRGECFAYTYEDRIEVEKEVSRKFYKEVAGSKSGSLYRYANYMFPFTLNLIDRYGNKFYSGTVTPRLVSITSPASNGATCRISVNIPRSAIDWSGNLSLLSGQSEQSGNGLSTVWLDYDDATVTLTYTATPAQTSTSSSYVIRNSSYSYTTSDTVRFDIGNNYITYNPNGGKGKVFKGNETRGDGTMSSQVFSNSAIGFTRDHYVFDSWWTTAGNSGTKVDAGTALNMGQSHELYAHWRQTEFQVEYDANGADSGHSAVPSDSNWYDPGDRFTVKAGNLKKSHFLFDGWNTEPDGTGTAYMPGTSVMPGGLTENLKLYAQWKEAKSYTVEYLPGIGTGSMDRETYWDDGINNKVTVKQPDGINASIGTFWKWDMSDDPGRSYFPGNTFTVPTTSGVENIRLTARWGAKLTYDAGTSSGIVGTPPEDGSMYELGSNAAAKNNVQDGTALYRHKYTFRGWDDTAGGTSDQPGMYIPGAYIRLDDNKTVYAHWSPSAEYRVSYLLNMPDGVSLSDVTGNMPVDTGIYYNDGIDNKVEVSDENGVQIKDYEFGGWRDQAGNYYDVGDTLIINNNTPENIELKAQWHDMTHYSVTYDANVTNGEVITGAPPTDTMGPYYGGKLHGIVTVLGDNSMKRSGYQFAGWNTKYDGSGDSYAEGDTFPIWKYNSDVTLFAQWKKELIITGVDIPDKDYDKTADFTGKITFIGAHTGDDISITGISAAYRDTGAAPNEQAGTGKEIVFGGVALTGADTDKYCIQGSSSNGTFDAVNRIYTYTAGAEIRRLPITIEPYTNTNPIKEGKKVPDFHYRLKTGNILEGEDLYQDFGTPSYQCRLTKEDGSTVDLIPGNIAAGISDQYVLSMSGLSNPNYNITYDIAAVEVAEGDKNQVNVTYNAGLHGQGTVPSDTGSYYVYPDMPDKNSVVTVMDKGDLECPGCKFIGWSKTENALTADYDPGDPDKNSFKVEGDTVLYAVWQADTELEITDITQKTKEYDGTASWSGGLVYSGALDGDDVEIRYGTGEYDNKNAGENKTITAGGLTIIGDDAYKYYIGAKGIYNKGDNTVSVADAKITKRIIKVSVTMQGKVLLEGQTLPDLDYDNLQLVDGTVLGEGDSLDQDTFGAPVFDCVDADGNPVAQAPPAGEHILIVSGLNNPNYDITYAPSKLTVKEALAVTYHSNLPAGEVLTGGSAPIDSNSPYRAERGYDTVTVLGDNGMLRSGHVFAGWNTKEDGTGDAFQENETFQITDYNRDVVLYAQWKKAITITGVDDPDKTYDGSSKFTGAITFSGAEEGDQVSVRYISAAYRDTNGDPDAQAGPGKEIICGGLILSGADAHKYGILGSSSGGTYNKAAQSYTYEAGAQIVPRDITVEPYSDPAIIKAGDIVPEFTCKTVRGSLVRGEKVTDTRLFGTPVYTCIQTGSDGTGTVLKPGDTASLVSESYELSMSGLKSPNYTIDYVTSNVKVRDTEGTLSVTYKPGNNGRGTAPSDTIKYEAGDTVRVKTEDGLNNPGCIFLGWDTDPNAVTPAYAPYDITRHTFTIQKNMVLYAIWQADTPLTITGITGLAKTYDGTAGWKGNILFTGRLNKDDVKVVSKSGSYENKFVGTGKKITLSGIKLEGKDSYKYYLNDGGIYNKSQSLIQADNGEIKKRRIVITAKPDPGKMNFGGPVQKFSFQNLRLTDGSVMGKGDLFSKETLGTPVFTCKNADGMPLRKGSPAGRYTLSVSGLYNENYEIVYKSSFIDVIKAGDGTQEGDTSDDSLDPDNSPDPDKGNGSSKDNETPQDGTDNRSDKGFGSKNTTDLKNGTGSEKKSAGSNKNNSSYRLNKGVPDEGIDKTVIFGDEQVPLGQRPEGWDSASKDGAAAGRLSGLAALAAEFLRCLIHWIILLAAFLMSIYCLLRHRCIKKKEPEERKESLILDSFIPMLVIPLSIYFYFIMHCVFDIWFVALLCLCATVGYYKIHRLYKEETESEEELKCCGGKVYVDDRR